MPAPALFEPMTIRGITIPNRIWVSPLCEYSAGLDGIPTDWHLVHLGSFAIGRAGLVMAEATAITPEGRISPADVGIWNEAQVSAWKRITDFIKSQGVVPAIQLAHAGRKASSAPGWGVDYEGSANPGQGGWQTVGPGNEPFPGYEPPVALDEKGIDRVVELWTEAAKRALEAGFQVIEIHSAHGYLLHQFLSPLSNSRTDEYGGSLENRARLLRRVVRRVRETVGETVPVLVRVSATDWHEHGLTLEEIETITKWVAEDGADHIDVSTGGIAPGIRIPTGPGYQVKFAESIRAKNHIPTNAVGQITDPEQANEIVSSGKADAVMLGREFMRDPHFPLRASTALGYKLPNWPPQYLRAQP